MNRGVRILTVMGVLSATSAVAAVVDFEELAAPGNGTGGLKVGNHYAAIGLTFNFPTALDYSQGTPVLPGFAHSGTKAVELCYGFEFCTGPLQLSFTTAQAHVKVWVGYSGALDSAQTVVMRAYNAFGQVAQATATLGPSTGAIPIGAPLEVTVGVATIVRVTVGFTGAEASPASIFNNSLAVDDVEFTAGPPPPCPALLPPGLTVSSPTNGQIFVGNVFTLDTQVATGDPFATMRLDTTGAGGASGTLGPFFITPGHVVLAGITGFLMPGENSLRVTVNDCRGTAQVNLTVFYRSDVTETVIHVIDESGLDVPGAEVYVNGLLRGRTNSAGRLAVSPPLPDGSELVARKLVGESTTYRGNHSGGSFQDWKFRVYITSLPVNNDGSTPPKPVVLEPDPLAPQELVVLRRNTLIGLHVVASLEWDASPSEIEDVQNRFQEASKFLYNATDGQMLYERVNLVDDAAFWDDADYRIYGNISLRANVDCPRGSFFDDSFWCGRSWMHLPRAPCVGCYSWFAKFQTYVHEFGHYGLVLGDEYSDDDPSTYCTAALTVPGPFQSGMPQASCMMWSENSAPKICSSRPENPHVHGTRQGDSSCWHDILEHFGDDSGRWVLQSPDTRGTIPGQVNGGRIPIPTWAPEFTIRNGSRPNQCAPVTFLATRDDGSRIEGAEIWLLTTYGAQIYQGQTDNNGALEATGLHVGDRVGLSSWIGTIFGGDDYTITAADCAAPALAATAGPTTAPTRQLVARPSPFDLLVALEPTSHAGRVRVRVSTRSRPGAGPVRLAGPPIVKVALGGQLQTTIPVRGWRRAGVYYGFITDLPLDAQVSLEVTATDVLGRTVARLERLGIAGIDPDAETTVSSPDGALSLTVPAGGLRSGARVSIGPSPVRPPGLPPGYRPVIGPYDLASSVGNELDSRGTLRFHLPRLTSLPGASGFDPATLRVLRHDPRSRRWDDLGSGTFLPDPIETVSLQTQDLGTFVLIGKPASSGGGPDISHAAPTGTELWPPHHQLVSVGITGVTSANGPVSIVMTRVTTDEPTRDHPKRRDDDCFGCPDAFLDGPTARLRAERSGQGNGRVYTLYFTASDPTGHSSSGHVAVCVPHNPLGNDCVDDRRSFDATVCPGHRVRHVVRRDGPE